MEGKQVDLLLDWLRGSNYTVVFTGAGMSTESGLPDFRSSKGLWKQQDPSRVASIDSLNKNVEAFIDFYRQRVIGVHEYKPHKGHHILAKWEKEGRIQSIITQNVDGFHQMAGSSRVHELHGTLQRVHCQKCGREESNERYLTGDVRCECGGIFRPNVVLFGEPLPQEAFQNALADSERAELFIVLGSSLTVTPANQMPVIAKRSGAKLVIVNMDETPLDGMADLVIHGEKIGELLEKLDSRLP